VTARLIVEYGFIVLVAAADDDDTGVADDSVHNDDDDVSPLANDAVSLLAAQDATPLNDKDKDVAMRSNNNGRFIVSRVCWLGGMVPLF
jgi:hypothetical protein